jgi:hypothetical protein
MSPWVETHGDFPTWPRHGKGIPHRVTVINDSHRVAVMDHSRGLKPTEPNARTICRITSRQRNLFRSPTPPLFLPILFSLKEFLWQTALADHGT